MLFASKKDNIEVLSKIIWIIDMSKNCIAKTLSDSVISGNVIKKRIPPELVETPHQLNSIESFYEKFLNWDLSPYMNSSPSLQCIKELVA